jgi:ketosteroid isomerase-like protein
MSEQDNIRVVREMFAAFVRGDAQAVLDTLADDVEWRLAGPTQVTYAGIRRGKDKVADFFKVIAEASEFEQFEAEEFLAQGDKVVAFGHERQRIKSTGQVVENDWAMVFTLRDGKIARYRNYVDTAAHRGR